MTDLPTTPGTYQSWLWIPSPVVEGERGICSQAWLRLDEDGRWWWHHWDKVLPVDPADIDLRFVRPCDWQSYGRPKTPKARLQAYTTTKVAEVVPLTRKKAREAVTRYQEAYGDNWRRALLGECLTTPQLG